MIGLLRDCRTLRPNDKNIKVVSVRARQTDAVVHLRPGSATSLC